MEKTKTGLAFSGGKDSWACLWLNYSRLDDITVLWVNTGKNYPELLKTVSLARSLAPNFVEIRSDQAAQNSRMGLPSDVVPVRWTREGMQFSGPKPVVVQSYLSCCAENISAPLHQTAKKMGLTHVIRGQRREESHSAPANSGDTVDGITYLQPIEHWTSQEVLDYVAKFMPLPGHFSLQHSSMDCYDCTAFRDETADRVAYTRDRHPELHQEYLARARQVEFALRESMK